MQKSLSKAILKLFKWEIIGEVPTAPKYVLVIAPHTSILDVIMGKLYNWAVEMKARVMIKQEFFFFPLGALLKLWGGLPVNRKHPGGLIKGVTEKFEQTEELILGITPEGTRAANPNWKTGFHRIATAANVPVYLSMIDFKTKKIGVFQEFKLTENIQEDIAAIKEIYRGMEGYQRGKFVL